MLRPLLLALLLAAPAMGGAAPSDAPLGVLTPGTFRSLFLDLPLADARGAAAPALDVRWWLANDWSRPTELQRGGRSVMVQDDVQTDALQLSLTLPWRRLLDGPLARRLTTTVEARLLERWGGWTDRPIEAWHSLVGSWNFQRELYPRDAINVVLAEPGGRTLADIHSPRFAVGDLALRTALRLAGPEPGEDGEAPWAIALRLDLKVPLGSVSSLGGSGGFDAGAGLAASAALLPWLTGHGLVSLRTVSDLPGGFPLQPRRFQAGLDLSLVARVGAHVALLLEDRLSTPLVEDGWSLPPGTLEPEATAVYALTKARNQISGGVRIGSVTIFLQEDFTIGPRLPTDPGPSWFYDSNDPDLVLGLAWAGRL